MTSIENENARIVSIRGSTVKVKGLSSYRMGEIVYVGDENLMGEIIAIDRDLATLIYDVPFPKKHTFFAKKAPS